MPSATLTITYFCGVISILIICVRLILRVVVAGAMNVTLHPHASALTRKVREHLSKREEADACERGGAGAIPPTGTSSFSSSSGARDHHHHHHPYPPPPHHLPRQSTFLQNGNPSYRQAIFKADDIVMFLSVIPLVLRMVMIHLVLMYGTNTWLGVDSGYDREVWLQLRKGAAGTPVAGAGGHTIMVEVDADEARELIVLGSKVVIVGRLAYAGFLWCMKVCVLIFYQRLVPTESSKRYAFWIKAIWVCLGVSFLGVIFATVGECRPLHLYWQLAPFVDKCAYAQFQLYTLGITNILTDFALIVLPLPLIFRSRLPLMRKIHLGILFSIGLFLIAITITRLPIIALPGKGLQDARTLWASIEIGAACIVANAPVLYSLIKSFINTFRPLGPPTSTTNPTGYPAAATQFSSGLGSTLSSLDGQMGGGLGNVAVMGSGASRPAARGGEQLMVGGGTAGEGYLRAGGVGGDSYAAGGRGGGGSDHAISISNDDDDDNDHELFYPGRINGEILHAGGGAGSRFSGSSSRYGGFGLHGHARRTSEASTTGYGGGGGRSITHDHAQSTASLRPLESAYNYRH